MSEFNLVEDFDYAITSVRDTDWHWIEEGVHVGVAYGDIDCAVTECAEKWQASHDKLTEQNKLLREALDKVISADAFHYQDDAEYAESINYAKDILGQTSC